MNQIESTIQSIAPVTGTISEDFLPSLYRITLILGMLITVGIAGVTHSSVWAGSFFFGTIASLAFLKAQEVFLKRLLASSAPQPKSEKASKSIWFIMIGKYFLLAGVMAGGLHFQVLNLIAFVFGFALLHVVMVGKVLVKRGASRSVSKETVTTDVPQHRAV
ncbi:MAG: hypothetical protein ABI210_09090 [Abditibacteriaceae bacterium]